MTKLPTISDLISRWPTARALAVELGLDDSESAACRVRAWAARGSIPSTMWTAFVAAAEARGHWDISEALLAKIAKREAARRAAERAAARATESSAA